MNTLAYLIYLFLTYLITVRVGLLFYRNGRLFILELLHGDAALAQFINRALLVGYYLVNLGYAALMLQRWSTVNNPMELLVSITTMTGKIMLTLAFMHFANMGWLYLSREKLHSIKPPES
ncbi:hypothetical protein DCC81_15170 [Chitinophaga parva]|uniref:Uncharacterized protein n=1 Tax=Chitinophaga parva TaxID=2169414 RepID=A0A2T7BH90_9BACT|nr:hypothetical protein [Chitinophaga parva]PUZ25613.1 hypothetical protein DCC81_15170 [Chitinophaga parva]